jgi:hypothetical protein
MKEVPTEKVIGSHGEIKPHKVKIAKVKNVE